MKKYVIWLLILHLCYCENIDYSDYFPDSVPIEVRKPSPEYKEVMRNLCDNWHSPINYLQKRGYMPTNLNYEPKEHLNSIERRQNYFFFPDEQPERPEKNLIFLENDENPAENVKNEPASNQEPPEPPPVTPVIPTNEEAKNETGGIINKVKDKFFSIFTHKNKSDQIDAFDLDDPEFLENEAYDDYDISNRRIFTRSVTEKPANPTCPNENLISNLTSTEISFIKNFIEWFKKYKSDLKFLSSINSNITANATHGEKPSTTTTTTTTTPKPEHHTTTESASNNECFEFKSESPPTTKAPPKNDTEHHTTTTVKPNPEHSIGDISKNATSNPAGNVSVDLDINQKNGTGEEFDSNTNSSSNSICSQIEINPKYIIKSKFLAHLHHTVDEVGKPPHKPLDLDKVQNIIDKSKYLATVIMSGDSQTTECVPLQLNDLSFDLEWNKVNQPNSRDKFHVPEVPYTNDGPDHSLASKFLQEVNSNPRENYENLKTPYADNFLDSQQALPNYWEHPVKVNTKREVDPSRYRRNEDPYSFGDPYDDDANFASYDRSPKRRIKGRIKGLNKKKKQKSDSESESLDDLLDDSRGVNGFDTFQELKDIQFRVNDNDEEAISTFIANLNSPPEVFSFDVDKYLKTAKENIEPKSQEYQSPETRTYYEFMDAPAVENEVLPLIEPPADSKVDAVVDKRSRKTVEKRDLLRQYIKGVSNALNTKYGEFSTYECSRNDKEKAQRSTPLQRKETPLAIDQNLIDSDTLDNLAYQNDISSNNYFILNDGTNFQEPEAIKQDPEILPNDFAQKSLELDLDLDKKFKDLNIGKRTNNQNNNNNNDLYSNFNSQNLEKQSKDNEEEENTIDSG